MGASVEDRVARDLRALAEQCSRAVVGWGESVERRGVALATATAAVEEVVAILCDAASEVSSAAATS